MLVPLLGIWLLEAPAAFAQSRTAPAATQHALDELANCYAQRKCATPTPTPTLVPTAPWTPSPIPSSTPIPTDAPEEPTATPLPALPVGGAGYTRPLDDHWLELAVQEGRWAVYQADDCDPRVDAWANVITQVQDDGEVDLVSAAADCGLVAEQWLSDAPCSVNDQGVCDVSVDASYWDWLSQFPTPTPTDTPVPTVARPTAAPAAAAAPRQAAPVQQAPVVVYVQVTPTPTDVVDDPEPSLAAAATPQPTPSPVATVVPWWLAVTPTVTVTTTPTDEPQMTAASIDPPDQPPARPIDWGNVLAHIAAAAGVIVLVVGGAFGLTRLAKDDPVREEDPL
ncbi:MAG TPA: hypothetical protein VGK33_19610 [Chloroflexota bacterium]